MGLTYAYRNLIAQMTLGETYTPFNASNAYLGVGDGTTAFDPSQTDLQGTNKYRKQMDGGYPQRTNNVMTFQATFGPNEANFAWNEWGVFNAATGGVMMNRKLTSYGTKPSNQAWQLRVTITIELA